MDFNDLITALRVKRNRKKPVKPNWKWNFKKIYYKFILKKIDFILFGYER